MPSPGRKLFLLLHHKFVYIRFAALYNGVVTQAISGFDSITTSRIRKNLLKGATIGKTEF
jgi:hypothetical protein